MSEKTPHIVCAFPDKEFISETGAVPLAIVIYAANERAARAKATMLFVDEYPDADDSRFEFRVYQSAEGIPEPGGVEAWNDTFLTEHPWDEELGHPVMVLPESVNFEKLSKDLQNAVMVKYDRTTITKDLLPAAFELLQDEASTFDGHIVEALNKTPFVDSMWPELKIRAITWVRAKCASNEQWPAIKAELVNWKKAQEAERNEHGSAKSIVDIARENAAQKTLNAAPGKAESKLRPARPYKHTHATLDQEIASALWPGDVTPGNVDGKIYRWAKSDVIGKDREDWKRISMSLRTQENVLRYDAQTIFDLVRDLPEGIHKSPAVLNNYICEFLSEHGVFEDENQPAPPDKTASLEDTTATPGPVEPKLHDHETVAGALETAAPVERTGPFYFLCADGEKIGRANKLPGLEKAVAEGGKEISQEEYQARKNGTFTADTRESAEQPQATPPGNDVDQNDTRHEPVNAPVTTSTKTPAPDSFVVRADELEKEIGDSENLGLWKSVMRTNPRYTKDLTGAGFEGTSINAQYMIMRATEKFGPVGSGWGFEILEDKMIPGAPLTEKIFEGQKFVGKRILRDGDGSLMTEQNHYLKIRLWYLIECDVRGEIEAYGSTPYMYATKNGVYCDSEVHKKSLTDAIKKALSHLGFSADVWLGLYDDPGYKAESHIEFGIKDASDRADDSTRIREELDERFKGNVETMRKAVSQNEVSKIASSLTRTIAVHLKVAKETADSEYAKYLEGRLRRLEEVKAECLRELEEAA
ncbi:exodeoxyribonuclease VIII [Mangrovibacter phragmitis]|uniref:exodeoxyribonuclease VIII n=1 Tax=Mangrovibacter phragmitis TaxID=1691903 RepID=UPI0035118B75